MARLTEEMVIARAKQSDMSAVKKLNCWRSELVDVSLLRRMPNVEVLSLSVNKISTLVDFAYCSNLRELYVRKNRIADLTELRHLQALRRLQSLWLGENPCATNDNYRMTVLRALPCLEKLDNVTVTPEEVHEAMKKGTPIDDPENYDIYYPQDTDHQYRDRDARSMESSPDRLPEVDPDFRRCEQNAKHASINTTCISARNRSSTPINTLINFVPEQEAWIVERMGKFHRILEPGLNCLWPIIDRITYVQSLKEIVIDVPKQRAISADYVTLYIDGVLYLRIINAYQASYGVEDPEFAIMRLAQTTMSSELGKISLDKVLRESECLSVSILQSINEVSEGWGIRCVRYGIRDIKLPFRVQEAMQMQVEAEIEKKSSHPRVRRGKSG